MRAAALIAFAVLVVGCGARNDVADGGDPDAGVIVESDYPLHIRVVSWNLGNFAADAGEPQRVGPLLRSLAPQLVVLQEIPDEAAVASLTQELSSGWAGTIAPATTSSPAQRVALLWNDSRVKVTNITPLHEQDALFPRAVLSASISATTPSREVQFALVAVHLKAGIGSTNEGTRIQESGALAQDVSSLNPVVVIGDFNEAISDPQSASVFAPWASYNVPSLPLADAGTVTFLPANLMLDHCVVSSSLDAGLSVPRLDQTVSNYATDVSDHLPLVLDLTL